MHRAGFTTTFPSPPDTNLAKNENQRNRKPPRMVYYSMLPVRAVCPDCPSRVQDNKSSLKSDGQRCN
jgi:hypothetical protein